MNKKVSIIIALMLVVSVVQVPLFANKAETCKKCCLASSNGKMNGAASSAKQEKTAAKDIVDIAAGDDRFETLVAALKAAGLVDTLKGKGPFTVFAPTDDAFDKLPAGTIDELLKPENKDKLVNILTYHVAGDKLTAADVSKLAGKDVNMLNGDKARIEVKDGSVFINGAKVIATDIMANNGIIHVIDTVMMPPTDKMD